MSGFVRQRAATALWYDLVKEARDRHGGLFSEDLESYLVFLLNRFIDNTALASSALGVDYLLAENAQINEQQQGLRDVGDQCLLLTGLFPQRIERRQLNITYYVDLGRCAYSRLSDLHDHQLSTAELFGELRQNFIELMELLHCIRELGDEQQVLSLVQAEELWRNTGSVKALQMLQQLTDSLPLPNAIHQGKRLN